MFRKLLVMGAVVLLAGFAQTAIAAGTGSISGTVVRHADGTPLAGVLVQLSSPFFWTFTFTDTVGNYAFTGLAVGMYDIHIPIQKIGVVHYTGTNAWNVEVREGQDTVVNFSLREAALIYGYVKTTAGVPLSAMAMAMVDEGAPSFTDPLSGRYELWVAPSPGEFYPIIVDGALLTGQTYKVYGGDVPLPHPMAGYDPGAHNYTLLGTATSTQTFTGTYTEANYVALVDTVEGAANSFYSTTATGNTLDWGNVGGPPDGLFASVGAEWGFGGFGGYILIQPTAGTTSITVHIGADGRGHHPVHYEFKWDDNLHKATAGVPTRVDFSLKQAGAISGRVVDGAGVGIPNVNIKIEVVGGVFISPRVFTDEAGHFILNHLSPGLNYYIHTGEVWEPCPYTGTLRPGVPGPHQVSHAYKGPITVVSGQTYNVGNLTVVVYQAGKISGIVTDEVGNPISDVLVKIEGKDIGGSEFDGQTHTDISGKYTSYVAPGIYHLEFTKEGFVPQRARDIKVGKGQLVENINVVLQCATKGVSVSGRIINYGDIAPKDAFGVQLPGLWPYILFDLPMFGVMAVDMGHTFTEKDFLDLSPFIVNFAIGIEDGYTDYFETHPLEVPGRYTMPLLPSGDTALGMGVLQFHLPGEGGCITFHNWQRFGLLQGEVQSVDFTASTAPTGILKGNLIVPPGYDHFPAGWAIIYAFNEAYPIVMPLADAIAYPGRTTTYEFRNLPAGTYTLKIYKRGFTSLVYTGVTVDAGQTTTKDIAFAPGVDPDPVVTDPGNGCLIATAAFGTPLAEEVEVLSRLRDEYLLTNELGKSFVAFYERYSPQWAEFISEREWAKRIVRIALRPIVRIAELIIDQGKCKCK